ncbi:MAG: L-rhamnose mutarotase [Chloroflexota bacterium]|nr:L-rhamnose mutarotase [Chloroflexota bacterium]
MEEDLETALASMEGNAASERWQQKMSQLMETDGEANPWKSMTEIFHLE